MRAIVVAICAALVLAACAEDEPSEPTQAESSSIRFQVSGEQEEIAVYEALVEAYTTSNPNAKVRLIPVADKGDHLARLATAFAGGEPPDVFLVNFREYSQFVVRGAIEAIDPNLEDLGMDLGDYYPQPLEAFTFEDELQCMPQNISSLVVYYNRKLFKQAGLDRPSDDWTWDDFRETAIALTDEKVRGLGIEPNVIRIAPFVWSNGGEIVDDPDSPTRFTLDEPKAREALEFIVSLVRDDKVVPTAEELEAQDLETRFMTDKLGMLLSSRRDTPAFREVLGLDWDIAPLPIGVEPAGILHSDAYCVSTGTDVDAAFDFVAFATGEEGETITALGGRTVPSLESVANSGAFLDPTRPPRHSQVFLDAIPVIRRTPVLPTWPEIESIAEEYLTRAYYEEGYSIDQFLSDLDEETRALFEEGAAP